MKTIGWVALVSLAVAACGGQVGSPETVDNDGGYGGGGSGSGTGGGGSGSGTGTGGGSGYGSGSGGGGGYGSGSGGGGYGSGTGGGGGYGSGSGGGGYGSGTGTGGGSGYGSGSGGGGGYGSGSGGGGYGSGSGSGSSCDYPPGDIACSFPAGCTGELDCVDGEWTCEIDECGTVGPQCFGDPPYCVDECGDYEASYCDSSGNWACPPSPPCVEDGGVIIVDAGVLPP